MKRTMNDPMTSVLAGFGVVAPKEGMSILETLLYHGRKVTEIDLGNQTVTLQRFAKENPKGSFYFTMGKAPFVLALVDGALIDTTGGKIDKRFLRSAHRVWAEGAIGGGVDPNPTCIPTWMLMSEDPSVQLAVRNMRGIETPSVAFKEEEPETRVQKSRIGARAPSKRK